MSPPDKPGIPQRFRRPIVEAVTATAPHTPVPPRAEQRPAFANPQPQPQPEIENADDRPSVVEFQREVHAGYGGAQFRGPAWLLILILLIAALGLIIYLLATRGQPVAVDCASKESVTALGADIEKLNTRFTALTEKVIADSERQHNDLIDLKLKVIEQGRAK
jgi:hypothetical protein